MAREIIFDMLNPYPTPVEFYKHELDDDVVYVYFTKNSVPFSVNIDEQGGDYTAVVAITIDDIIITEELQPRSVYNAGRDIYGIGLDFSDYDLFAGLMKVEFKISPNASPTTNYVPIIPLMINITPSILDDASATPESIGSVADMLQLYPDLKSIVDNGVSTEQIAEGAVTLPKLGSDVASLVNGALQYEKLNPITSFSGFNQCSQEGTIYSTTIAGQVSLAMNGATGSAVILKYDVLLYVKMLNSDQLFKCTYGDVQNTLVEVVNPKITALENTVGTLNDQLENALNGGGS